MKLKIKWGDIFFEIFAIFVGITSAFFVGKYTDNLKEEKLKKEYLTGIRDEIIVNIKNAENFNDRQNIRFVQYNQLEAGIVKRNIHFDSILSYIRPVFLEDSYRPFLLEFEALKESGNLNLISDKKLLMQLFRLYNSAKELMQFNEKVRDHISNKLTPSLGKYMDLEEFDSEHVKSEIAKNAILDRDFRNNVLLTVRLISSQKFFTKQFIGLLKKTAEMLNDK